MPRNDQLRVEEKAVENTKRSHGPNITALNDDCLREIFSFLLAKDLAAVKMSCDRFSCLADEMFEKNCFNRHGTYEVQNEDGYDGIAAIMSQFGHLIPSVDLDFIVYNTNTILSLLKQCPALQKLSIAGMNFNKIPIESLEIETFEKLEKLALVSVRGSESKFKLMLNLCDPMKMKSMIICSEKRYISDGFLGFLADRFINLEFLWIIIISTTKDSVANALKLENLKKLKTLDIKIPPNFPTASLVRALAGNRSLELLTLRTNTVMDEDFARAINSLSKNVLCCELWLDKRVPESLLAEITNFKYTNCSQYHYDSGRAFYEYKFSRCTSNDGESFM